MTMLLELLIAGHLQTYNPQPEPEVKEEPQIIEIVKEKKPKPKKKELTLQQKIDRNYYKCDTETQYIRADNAKCLDKPITRSIASTVNVKSYSSSPGNTYSVGYCTHYVKQRIPGIPNGLGDAINWINGLTRTTARPGVVAWSTEGGGHVAYVESVSNGMVTVSEQNFVGYGVVSYRTEPVSHFTYLY